MSVNALQDDDKLPASHDGGSRPASSVMAERLRVVNANTPAARAEREKRATEVLFARVGKLNPWEDDLP